MSSDCEVKIEIDKKPSAFYKDYLYKKLKAKAEILESQLENIELHLSRANEIPSLYNVSIPTQDDVWICGRVYSDNAVGGGCSKLTEHNIHLQGSYMCSNSHSVPLDMSNCHEYSLFPGQLVLANGRNPDGKKFLCKQIVEPLYLTKVKNDLEIKSDLTIVAASGPYMTNGSLATDSLSQLVEIVKAKKANVLILLGPFIDANHDLLTTSNTQLTYEQHFNKLLDELAGLVRNLSIKVIIQPSLNDLTQEPVYPVMPFQPTAQFLKQNSGFYFTSEPSVVKINGITFAMTSTDVIKDLTMLSISKTSSTDRISRNFSHLLRQKNFYPVYPPPEHICIDYEAWNECAQFASAATSPNFFIVSSDLATFSKEVNGCTCLNTGRLVRGTTFGSYALIQIKTSSDTSEKENTTTPAAPTQATTASPISVTFHKLKE